LLVFNQDSNTVSHPSSLVLAVISAILSRGVYESISAIFLKSFTACEQLAALPPTPIKNILPLFFFKFYILSMTVFI